MLSTNAEDFVRLTERERGKGLGFIPLLGAGVSVPSGIPTTGDLRRYLAFCTARALGLADGETLREGRGMATDQPTRWIPREHDWPALHHPLLRKGVDWEDRVRSHYNVLVAQGRNGRTDPQWGRNLAVHQEALGALADWRSSLQFLSRLNWDGREWQLDAPDNQVADSFFLHVVSHTKPSLAHRMTAHLTDLLRLQTLLTTNFDDLIEVAFLQLDNPLTVFDVHLRAGLPPARIVCAQRSIVKLHGGRYGLRADFSLDALPNTDDERHFAGYLFGDEIPRDEWRRNFEKRTKHHLLVAGVSGNDRRTLSLIESALNHLPDLQVFWICYLLDEATEIVELFREQYFERVHVVQHAHVGLLLLQLYQKLAQCIPPGGIEFPSVSQLPVPPQSRTPPVRIAGRSRKFNTFGNELGRKLDGDFRALTIASQRDKYGVATVAAELFRDIQTRRKCVWIDLDDVKDAASLFTSLATAFGRVSGIPDLMPRLLHNEPGKRHEELSEYMGGMAEEWMVFLNARDGIGTNTTLTIDEDGRFAPCRWNGSDANRFREIVDELTDTQQRPRIRFVILRFSDDFLEVPYGEVVVLDESCIQFDVERAIEGTLTWLGHTREVDRRVNAGRFVYALTLFRQARFPAALNTWLVRGARVLNEDRDVGRAILAEQWIRKLSDHGVVQLMDGGFIAIHREVRRRLSKELEKEFEPELAGQTAEIHQCIADWYYKLFLSSGDPLAAFELVYHRIECAMAADRATFEGVSREQDLSRRRNKLKESAIREAINTLTSARTLVLSRGYGDVSREWLHDIQRTAEDLPSLESRQALCSQCERLILDLARESMDFQIGLQSLTQQSDGMVARSHKSDSVDNSCHGKGGEGLRSLEDSYEIAILLTGLRSYQKAGELFKRVAAALQIESLPEWRARGEGSQWSETSEARQMAYEWVSQVGSDPERLRFAVKLLRRYMNLQIEMAHCIHVAHRGDMQFKEVFTWHMIQAHHCYNFALEVMRFIPNCGDGFLERENAYLRSQLAFALAGLGRYYEAHRRLVEAATYLVRNPTVTELSQKAVIDLRMAQIKLTEAARVSSFQTRRNQMVHMTRAGSDAADEVDWKMGADWKDEQRLLIAVIGDARCALERARRFLSGQRKNVWWWATLYELQMKTCEFYATVRVEKAFDDFTRTGRLDTTFPGKWIPEEILRDCFKVVPLDAFRLARVVESYGNYLRIIFAMAKRWHQELDGDNVAFGNQVSTPLTHPVRQSRKMCEWGIERLKHVLKEREEASELKMVPLSSEIRKYVDQVVSQIGCLCDCISECEKLRLIPKDMYNI